MIAPALPDTGAQGQEITSSQPMTSSADLATEMYIPDIVHSLTDIFTRSTNLDFRTQTPSRVHMSYFLEEALKKIIKGPSDSRFVGDFPHEAEENNFDDWDDTLTSKFSPKDSRISACTTNPYITSSKWCSIEEEIHKTGYFNRVENEDFYMEMSFDEDIIKVENELASWNEQ
ncbi:hypothetical protein PoB_003062500 [Plakobranchus ocellatus]|uniref:Uncharacterized protein n=1 Tax=Plakobranchus ocellatus TaxID=259542 RepID=A0AAV4A7I4_9GAST|nr:hypothetical protein PoB_003062500 [Plakobranchus ocellatus]